MTKIAIIGIGHIGKGFFELVKNHAETVTYDILDADYPKEKIKLADIAVICVPTPMNDDGSCNTSIVEKVISELDNEHILIKSTISPGTTEMLSKKYNKKICFSPEYIGESSYNNSFYLTMKDTPFLIIGGEENEVRYYFEFFEQILGPECAYYGCGSCEAELIKYMENSFLAAKVTFVNDFYEIVKAFGADWYTVREGWLLDGRIGRPFTSVFSGKRGYSGKCLPKDVRAIYEISKKAGYESKLLSQIMKTNDDMLKINLE